MNSKWFFILFTALAPVEQSLAYPPQWLADVNSDFKENSVRPDSISLYSDADGPWLRFQLSNTDPVLYVHRRAELARKKWEFNGTEMIYRLTTRVPLDWNWADTFTSIAQWHPGATPQGQNRVPPPLALLIRGDKWQVVSKHDDNPDTTPPWKEHILLEAPVQRGVPVRWEFHVKWNWRSSGFIRIKVDNKLVYDKAGPNAFNFKQGKGGVHMMFGLMKPLKQWDQNELIRRIDIKDVEVVPPTTAKN